jgi:hypothetical protein
VETASNYAPDVRSLFCGQCGAQIPVDSIFCPMCGFKAEPSGEATMFQLPQVTLTSSPDHRTAQLTAQPAPVDIDAPTSIDPSGHDVPAAAMAGAPMPAAPMPAAPMPAAPMPAAPMPAAPARHDSSAGRVRAPVGPMGRAPTASDHAPAHGRPFGVEAPPPPMHAGDPTRPVGPAPIPAPEYVPEPAPRDAAQGWSETPRRPVVERPTSIPPPVGRMPATPKPVRIVVGALFLVLSAGLALYFLPAHRPLTDSEEAAMAARAGQGEVLRQREARFTEEIHIGGNVGAAALALAGIGLILSGALYRPQAHIRCRRCGRSVIAWKGPFGLHCPLGEHYARVQWVLVGLTALFWSGLVVVAGIIALWLS